MLAATGFAIYALANEASAVRAILPCAPRILIGLGLLLALASAFLSVLLGREFFSSVWFKFKIPGGTVIELGSPVIFDIGVYVVVLGVTLTILLALAEQEDEL